MMFPSWSKGTRDRVQFESPDPTETVNRRPPLQFSTENAESLRKKQKNVVVKRFEHLEQIF